MTIKINNLTKVIKNNTVLNNINLELKSGNIIGLQGRNGSGKTMLLRAISGLIFPTSGSISIDEKIIGKDCEFPESMGIMIETPDLIGAYNAYQNLKVLSDLRGNVSSEEINSLIELVGLSKDSHKKFRQYSLGMKQKLGIAAAFLGSPDLLILDEPTNALDEESLENLVQMIEKYKSDEKLIIVSSHNKEELERISDIIYQMKDGKITGSYIPGGINHA